MAIYTKVNKEQIGEMMAIFGKEVSTFKPMGFGSANSNYVVENNEGKKFLLSIAEELSDLQVETNAKLLEWLDEHHFPTSRSIKTVEGDLYAHYLNKAITLRSWIPGKVEFHLSEGMLAEVGEQMASLHRLAIPSFLPEDHIYEENKFKEVIGTGKDPDFERWLEQRLEILNSRIDPSLPKGLIHGDLFADNIIFDDRKCMALIDFEMACKHFLVYDIGMAIAGLCTRDNELDLDKVKALVQAYMFYHDLGENEINALQSYAELSAVHTANWRFWKYNFASPTPAKSKKHLEMQHLANHIRRIPKEAFIETIYEE